MTRWASAPELFDPPDLEILDGLMLVRAAKWMGVGPWELAERPVWWLDMISLEMELAAQNQRSAALR